MGGYRWPLFFKDESVQSRASDLFFSTWGGGIRTLRTLLFTFAEPFPDPFEEEVLASGRRPLVDLVSGRDHLDGRVLRTNPGSQFLVGGDEVDADALHEPDEVAVLVRPEVVHGVGEHRSEDSGLEVGEELLCELERHDAAEAVRDDGDVLGLRLREEQGHL